MLAKEQKQKLNKREATFEVDIRTIMPYVDRELDYIDIVIATEMVYKIHAELTDYMATFIDQLDYDDQLEATSRVTRDFAILGAAITRRHQPQYRPEPRPEPQPKKRFVAK